jgi:hypothetical protein
VSITITPPGAAVPLGTTQQFTALGTYTDGTTQDITASGHWSSADGTVATISNTTATAGLASTLAAGTTSVGIAIGSVNAAVTLTVNPAALLSITISPQSPTISLGTSQVFTAMGKYTDGTNVDVTSLVAWSSSSIPVSIISNTPGSNGLATSAGVGTASITATLGSVFSSTILTVGQPSLVSIAVTPANPTIPLGTSQQFIATGTYTDGSAQDLTASATWSSSVPAVANAGVGGSATSFSQGATIISAVSATITGSATLTVSAPSLLALTVTPPSASIPLGTVQQFSAVATFTDGSSQNVTGQVNWASSNGTVATINGNGLATSVATGTAAFSANLGALTASANLSVTKPVLTAISVLLRIHRWS